jgi:hypothetical protein
MKVGATACEGSTASFKDTQESTSPPIVLVQHLRLPLLNPAMAPKPRYRYPITHPLPVK